MKKTILFILSVLFITNIYSQCADISNIYEFTYDEKTYEVVKELQTWENAAACAVERGGYLVEINSLEEQNAVYDAITIGAAVASNYVTISNGGGIAYVWIGATDNILEGDWLWDGNKDSSGDKFWTGQGANGTNNGAAVDGAYINWGGTSAGTTQEPDNYGSNQDCAAIALAGWPSGTTMLGVAGEWNDIISTSSIYYVIEYPVASKINDHSQKQKIEIYPNPSSGSFSIMPLDQAINQVKIIDITGKTICHKTNDNQNMLSFKNISKGIYFIVVSTENDTYIEKLVIQ